jgi:hypothetical protein
MKHLMVVGLGHVGSWATEFLMRTPGLEKLTTADINEHYGSRRTKAALVGASHLGYYPEVDFKKIDLMNVSQSAELLKGLNPDVILSTVSAITPYPGSVVSQDIEDLIEDAGTGPFLSAQLLLINKLMQAIEQANINPYVVNASFGDGTHAVLKKAGVRTPNLGIGNLDNLVPIVRMQVSKQINVKMRDVKVYLVGHHFNNVWCTRHRPGGMCPYLMKIFVGGKDLTGQFNTDELMLGTSKEKNRLGGNDGASLTSSSAVKHAIAFLNGIELFTHSPGPKAYIGGYPVYIKNNEVEISLPEGITLEQAIKINEEGQYRDGTEKIMDDGTAIFTDESVLLMKKAIGFECKFMKFNEHEQIAKELLIKMNARLRK